MSKFFPENVSVIGYNMKIIRYRKGILKISVWPGLRPPPLKSKLQDNLNFQKI